MSTKNQSVAFWHFWAMDDLLLYFAARRQVDSILTIPGNHQAKPRNPSIDLITQQRLLIIMSSSLRVLACAMFLLLQGSHAFLGTTSLQEKPTSSSQLSMAWTLPSQPSFRPSWYQDCGNPTARRVVYDDIEDDDFHVSNFAWESSATNSASKTESSIPEQKVLPRGARIGRAARRAIQGLRNTLRP
jgi:hypothetical protein